VHPAEQLLVAAESGAQRLDVPRTSPFAYAHYARDAYARCDAHVPLFYSFCVGAVLGLSAGHAVSYDGRTTPVLSVSPVTKFAFLLPPLHAAKLRKECVCLSRISKDGRGDVHNLSAP